jgi:hypothetical protein
MVCERTNFGGGFAAEGQRAIDGGMDEQNR